MRFTIAVVLLLFLSTGTSCQWRSSKKTAHDEIVVGLEMEPTNLDPRFATDAYSQLIGELIYSSLVRLDPAQKVIPDLAVSWKIKDAKEFLFILRGGVKFHNGKNFTAEDVANTFRMLLDEKTASPLAAALKDVEQVQVLDPKRVLIVLREPNASFLTTLVSVRVQSDCTDCKLPVGTGPFRVKKVQESKIELEGNPSYYGGEPKFNHLTFLVVRDEQTRLLKIKNGELDLLQNALPAHYVKKLREEGGFVIQRVPGANCQYIGFNMQDSLLKNVRVRMALSRAIDRKELIDHLLMGMATVAASLLPPSNWFTVPYPDAVKHDPERAKTLLSETGFGGNKGLELTLMTSTNSESIKIAQVIKSQLQKVGVTLQIQSREWGTFFDDIQKGKFQLFMLRWVGVTDPDLYYEVFHSSKFPPGRNRGRYANIRLDQMLERARKISDMKQRHHLYSEIQKQLSLDVPLLNLWHSDNVVVLNKKIQGFASSPTGSLFSLAQAKKE